MHDPIRARIVSFTYMDIKTRLSLTRPLLPNPQHTHIKNPSNWVLQKCIFRQGEDDRGFTIDTFMCNMTF